MQSSLPGGARRTLRRLATATAAAGMAAAMAGTATAAEAAGPSAPAAPTAAVRTGVPQGAVALPSALARAGTSRVAALPLNAIDGKGTLCGWNPSSKGGFGSPTCYSGYSFVNGAVAGSINSDRTEDVFLRHRSNGHLYGFVSGVSKPVDEGAGWNGYTALAMPGNLGGTAADDVVGRDRSGVLWVHPGYSNGHLGRRIRVGSGWNTYRAIFGKFDYTGDGRTDLLGVDYHNTVWVHPGTGDVKRPFHRRIRLATNFRGYDYVLSTGDVNRDGRSDFLARDTSGRLWLFRGYNRVSRPFAARYSLGTALRNEKIIF
ncbi:VCBS repeat-containing protein [Streptacidiphilus sp. ASG 303]|uniref:FG-GAP repeat domain-containing protein n=1 Tax=Streptacidiphilus sp. ASG 303 TaxID=2896847 RepID=UPI001E2D38E8|nr:VCBS repeat-containing protein [Streptacidiphilus sp. ASG 303]MCD0485677.1 VCBS repeat-containing protein [Streptacidiphilus sp. ASG 303]